MWLLVQLGRSILVACLVALCTGCSTIDTTLPERSYAVNTGSSNVRENIILPNIVRASQFEPLNFVALSKYTGTGSLGGSVTETHSFSMLFNILNKGAVQAGTTATNAVARDATQTGATVSTGTSFDLVPLDNKEFYSGFLAQLSLDQINLLVNAGLSRELVLNAIVKSARITLDDGRVFEFANDPTYDNWGDERLSAKCDSLGLELEAAIPFEHPAWLRPHEHDCNYQKFLFFLHAAVRFGMTTEPRSAPNPAAKTDKTAPKTISEVHLCYDPAIAEQYNKKVSALGACGSAKLTQGLRTYADVGLGRKIRLIQPVLRSPYAVFQYFGRLLATNTAHRVRLIDAGTPRMPTNDRVILTVLNSGGDCFAQAVHHGMTYCVPDQKLANNTKEVFILLNALVNLSTTRTALPVTPTVLTAP